jgi:succinate dehydrogenase / fumarate reductase flavoprotein subunit
MATGGVGRAYAITSNSWEYTGDGHALAYHAGADLKDLEFVQFHPTGMVWPPSVRGILVTEGVRGEGGVLLNKDGRRFLFDDIPGNYRAQTAESEDEGWRYTQGDKSARRPPELLTRDHVARCIMREVRDGRGSPHGGVYLDIAWIGRGIPNAAEHIRRSSRHVPQFKQLAGIDITKSRWRSAHDTTSWADQGGRGHADVDGRRPLRRGRAGLHGTNRLGGNSPGPARLRQARRQHAALSPRRVPPRIDEGGSKPQQPAFSRRSGQRGRRPYRIQHELQALMQEKVGIVRREAEMAEALDGIERLFARAARVGVTGNREYNPGWHTAVDLVSMLTCAEAITRSALMRKESRGGHFRDDFPEKAAEFGTFNVVCRKGSDGRLSVLREPIPEMRPDLRKIIEENA